MLYRIAFFVSLALFVGPALGDERGQDGSEISPGLRALSKKFVAYNSDFISMAKSYSGNNDFEYSLAIDLNDVASKQNERLEAADTVLNVYWACFCQNETNRKVSKELVVQELSYISKLAGLDIEETRVSINHTKMPGMALAATKMKDDLIETKAELDHAINFVNGH